MGGRPRVGNEVSVLGSNMLLSRENGFQPKHYTFVSIACKTPHEQRTGMIQVRRHEAQLVELIAIIWYDLLQSVFQIKGTFHKIKNSVSISPE